MINQIVRVIRRPVGEGQVTLPGSGRPPSPAKVASQPQLATLIEAHPRYAVKSQLTTPSGESTGCRTALSAKSSALPVFRPLHTDTQAVGVDHDRVAGQHVTDAGGLQTRWQ